ncbi:hypothetical protein [Granulicella sp. S156]|uniref:hypothetical protein n=1 Tax=Granulicella sp. S156 TaxID=1747224 RepID=UPI00131A7A38|nr:hypothetical protein [Granulicella sp. S156]
MQRFESHIDPSGQFARAAARLGTVLLLCWLAGCGKGVAPVTQTAPTTTGPQTYFAPYVTGVTGSTTPLTYTIDDVAPGTFSQTTYQPLTQPGPQVLNAGVLTVGQRGLRSLGITATYTFSNDTISYQVTPYPMPGLPGSFAVELAGQAGGLVQLVGQPVQPLVAATQCPNSSVQTYQFVTIPTAQWDPTTDTAYGSVEIASSGSDVTFKNISQSTLAGGEPTQRSASSVTGACGPTFFGNITNVPGQLVVTDPGIGTVLPAQAQIGIGSSGLLVENNGAGGVMAGTSPPLDYENVLGAGTGAVGLPKPTSALDTGTLVGAQYLGFIYEAGANSPAVTWSSNLASFGFSSGPSGCPSVKGNNPSSTIYGGDFPVNLKTGLSDPGPNNSQNPNYPYGNCDFVIDLGAPQDSSNSLYTQAKVWLGASYPGYSPSITYPFSAVAVAGQLGDQYAIFVIGFDSTQPWAIYLLQSSN